MTTATATPAAEDQATQYSREMFSPHPWQGRTRKELAIHGKLARLEIHTFKSGTAITTKASIQWISKDGMGAISRMGIGGGGDFYAKVIPDALTRCTEKAVKEQHSIALHHLATIEEKAREHYPTPATVLQDAKSA